MGFFSRLKKKEEPVVSKEEPVPEVPAEKYNVTVKFPSYFKAGKGEYHFFIDGEEHVCQPFASLVQEVSAGVHSFRVFSTPETLGDVTEEIEISSDRIISVQVNVRAMAITITCQDKVLSHVEFEKKFKEENHIKQ